MPWRPQARDTDGDTLDGRYEVYVGWDVDIRGIRRVFSSCAAVDTDSDGLADDKEAPGYRDLGPDELLIIEGPNQPRRDEFSNPIPGLHDSVAMALHEPITDPARRDSDGDTASDGIERVLGGNPLDKGRVASNLSTARSSIRRNASRCSVSRWTCCAGMSMATSGSAPARACPSVAGRPSGACRRRTQSSSRSGSTATSTSGRATPLSSTARCSSPISAPGLRWRSRASGGEDLRVGIHSFNLTREASCVGGETLDFTLYATCTAS